MIEVINSVLITIARKYPESQFVYKEIVHSYHVPQFNSAFDGICSFQFQLFVGSVIHDSASSNSTNVMAGVMIRDEKMLQVAVAQQTTFCILM